MVLTNQNWIANTISIFLFLIATIAILYFMGRIRLYKDRLEYGGGIIPYNEIESIEFKEVKQFFKKYIAINVIMKDNYNFIIITGKYEELKSELDILFEKAAKNNPTPPHTPSE